MADSVTRLTHVCLTTRTAQVQSLAKSSNTCLWQLHDNPEISAAASALDLRAAQTNPSRKEHWRWWQTQCDPKKQARGNHDGLICTFWTPGWVLLIAKARMLQSGSTGRKKDAGLEAAHAQQPRN